MTEESSRLLKVILGMLFILLLAGIIFLTLTKKSVQKSTPVTTNQVKTPVPSPEVKTPTETVAPVPVSQPAPAQSVDKLKELQGLLDAGTITPDEFIKQMNDFNSKSQVTPAAVQK